MIPKIKKENVILGDTRIPFPVKNEYLIIQPDLSIEKYALVRVVRAKKDSFWVMHEKNVYDKEKRTENGVNAENIILNLGKNPITGKMVMGIRIETWNDTKFTPLGDVHFFIKLDKKYMKLLKKCIWASADILKEKGINGFLPIEIHIKKGVGKYAGMYKKPSPNANSLDILTLNPKNWESITEPVLMHYILHELSHGVDFNLINSSLRMEWLEAYHNYIKVTKITEKRLSNIRTNFLKFGVDYTPEGREEDLYKEICLFIKEKHKLTKRNMILLQEEGNKKMLRNVWPSTADLSKQETVVTEYANKEAVEFFAESFALYLNPFKMPIPGCFKLPKEVKDLCKKTIKECKEYNE